MTNIAFGRNVVCRAVSTLVVASIAFAAFAAQAEPNMDAAAQHTPVVEKHVQLHSKKTQGDNLPFARKPMKPARHEGFAEALERLFENAPVEPDVPQVQGDVGGPHSDWIDYGM